MGRGEEEQAEEMEEMEAEEEAERRWATRTGRFDRQRAVRA